MAGDWIKFETATLDKGEVSLLAKILKIDPDLAIGKLVRFWSWADKITSDGMDIRVTSIFLDRVVYQPGFTDAMLQIGWLKSTGDDIYEIPNFDRQNGHTSKSRLDGNRRVAKCRSKAVEAVPDVTDERYKCNADVTKKRYIPVTDVTPEKRREEKRRGVATIVAPLSVPLLGEFPESAHEAWREWQEYRERRAGAKGKDKLPWTEQALHLSRRQIEAHIHTHGAQIVIDRITAAIVGNWQGLNLDKLGAQDLPGMQQPQEQRKTFAEMDKERKDSERRGPEEIRLKLFDWKEGVSDEQLAEWGETR